jgi:hypothetical protein
MYKNGLPFSENLAYNIRKLKKRVDHNKAAMIIIDGGVGEGKTTLMVHVLDYINSLYGLPQIDIKECVQLSMGGSMFLKNLRKCYNKKLPCCGYDEAGDFSKRGSLTAFNSMLNRTFETFRAFKCIIVIVLPNLNYLDQQIFDNQIPRFSLHLKGRTQKTGNYYGYSLYRTLLLKSRMSKMKIKNYAYVTVNPNIWGHFQDLDPVRRRELDKVSTKNKLDILRRSEIKIEGLLTYAELAVKLMRSVIWTRRAVNKLKLKQKRTIGRMKYFDPAVLNILLDHGNKVNENPKNMYIRRKERFGY